MEIILLMIEIYAIVKILTRVCKLIDNFDVVEPFSGGIKYCNVAMANIPT